MFGDTDVCGVSVKCCSAVLQVISVKGLGENGKRRDISVNMIQLFHVPYKQNTSMTQLVKDLIIKKFINILKGTFQAG